MRPQIDPFLAVGISVLAQKLRAEGRSIIPMSFGQPSTGAPKAALDVAHRVLDSEPGGYWESAPLRERIARHYDESYGVKVAPEQIILTCGASPALVLALASTFAPGDRVAGPRPLSKDGKSLPRVDPLLRRRRATSQQTESPVVRRAGFRSRPPTSRPWIPHPPA